MKKYDSYKDSGVEWIGEIPNHWSSIMLKRLSPVKRGASPRPIDDPKYFDENGEYAWVRIADLSASERYLLTTTQILSELGASLSVKREPDDFFLSIAGTVGKPIITKIKCCIHDGFVYFPNLKINPEFLYYIFSTGLPYKGLGKWGTQLNLNTDTVGEIFIPITQEIEEIINYLDCKTAEIDELIANKKRLIELYEEEKTVIINQAVTKGLDPNVKMKDSGIEWLGEIPEHWEVKILKYVAKVQTGRTPKIQSSTIDFFENGEVNWFTPGDFNGNTQLIESTRKINIDAIKQNEVEVFNEYSVYLVSIGATLGKIGYCYEKASANQQINVLSFDSTKYYPLFGFYFLFGNKEMITFEADYTTLPILNQTKTKKLWMCVPPLKEQQTIVHYIKTESDRINAKIEKTKKLIDLLTEYRTALISEVVTGKIKVTN